MLLWKVKEAIIPDPLDVTEIQKVIVKNKLCGLCKTRLAAIKPLNGLLIYITQNYTLKITDLID